ncbi:BTB/POZ domain containing protein [Trichomonas vaginalis G3]|uniref:BTB/POZ domain containing protein n=1 Tax=Trichomonas vaginalis (strain ATCC PRA-98 / G3) TaxID=412133 RepID=A2DGX3_TRIV3|nr:protein ubiquitination [Trichomonas vaginalis G3]EAY20283.1 BTB/POZ domain containing protein [Trichomonas vaginalis G3]KAI5529155.1 protein ubiquitination [Trichomonas vaginalis G3]|eukprot:XP_001581269.1 BTB/POZ domain containing protein [Trichomonas vaginalis G3]
MSAVRIKQRLISRFHEYLDRGQFVDLKLRHGVNTYQVHSLVLAKYSGWFAKTIKEMDCCPGDRMMKINLPEDPDDQFGTIIKILYTDQLTLDIKSAPALLRIATYYEMPHLQAIVRHFIAKTTVEPIINDAVLFSYASKFIQFKLIDDAIKLAPEFAKRLMSKSKTPSDVNKYIVRIYQEVKDGRVVAAIILDQNFLNYWSEEEKVAQLDRYHKFNPDITDDEKEALSNFNIINWKSPTAYQYLVKYQCDWLPPRVLRPLYESIFKYRRANAHHFEKDIQNSSSTVSRWYPFSWATQIANAIESESTPVVELISFITTLGGLIVPKDGDAVKFGLLNPNGNQKLPQEELSTFEMANIFKDDNSYYQAILYDDKIGHGPNFIVIELGKSCEFKPQNVIVDMKYPDTISDSLSKYKNSRKQHFPEYITTSSFSSIPEFKETLFKTDNKQQPLFEYALSKPFNRIYINPPLDGSLIVFRVRLVKIFGSFLQTHG